MKKYKIGYTSGVFDLFHIGHLNILRRAKERCDYLIVGVSTDELVRDYKNKIPIIPFSERSEIVASCRYVDKVVPQTSMDKMIVWEDVKFDVMFHGDEWKHTPLYNKYIEEFAKVGVEIVFLPHTKGICSTDLTKKINESEKTDNR
ncbi:adenylyltransferase/cytidyltransferase family protein [Bacteroides sp. 51]|uniref:adenylyltransferase/cytidyltransferase family protein n=1 Tax=Bacteroides sp. 51 TaxID=2302938 RepID=UPI0013D3F628|nr:adenylyltransferase/cytidyltransferase family protein [Bacteroides sp. 51]NDV82030.1 glycerol-3-phosphate cytidylyltransferase [Bacteroides sp. 51]